jgi:hypothetical protein
MADRVQTLFYYIAPDKTNVYNNKQVWSIEYEWKSELTDFQTVPMEIDIYAQLIRCYTRDSTSLQMYE